MKKMIWFIVVLIPLVVLADTYYVFGINKDRILRKAYTTAIVPPKTWGDCILISVTEAQYNAGYENLDTNLVNQAIADAKVDEAKKEYKKKALKALTKILNDRLMKIKNQNWSAVTNVTEAEFKAVYKALP